MKYISRVTKKGQITIPYEIREKLGIKPGDIVVFEIRNKEIIIRKAKLSIV